LLLLVVEENRFLLDGVFDAEVTVETVVVEDTGVTPFVSEGVEGIEDEEVLLFFRGDPTFDLAGEFRGIP